MLYSENILTAEDFKKLMEELSTPESEKEFFKEKIEKKGYSSAELVHSDYLDMSVLGTDVIITMYKLEEGFEYFVCNANDGWSNNEESFYDFSSAVDSFVDRIYNLNEEYQDRLENHKKRFSDFKIDAGLSVALDVMINSAVSINNDKKSVQNENIMFNNKTEHINEDI